MPSHKLICSIRYELIRRSRENWSQPSRLTGGQSRSVDTNRHHGGRQARVLTHQGTWVNTLAFNQAAPGRLKRLCACHHRKANSRPRRVWSNSSSGPQSGSVRSAPRFGNDTLEPHPPHPAWWNGCRTWHTDSMACRERSVTVFTTALQRPVRGRSLRDLGPARLLAAHAHAKGSPQRNVGLRDEPARHSGGVVRQRARTVVEWAERIHEVPPTHDDVTVLLDGRCPDSRDPVWAASRR